MKRLFILIQTIATTAVVCGSGPDYESNTAASLLLCEVRNPSQFGIAEIKNNKIIKITEKPKNPPTNLAVTGIYFLTPYIFEIIKKLKPSWRNELEIADALQMLVEEEKEIIYGMITDFWKDTGTPNDIMEANRIILENMTESFQGKKEENVILKGKIVVGEGTIIKKGVKIEGPTIIGKNCIIENDTIIGENTSIGDNFHLSYFTISNSIIISNCINEGKLDIKNSIIACTRVCAACIHAPEGDARAVCGAPHSTHAESPAPDERETRQGDLRHHGGDGDGDHRGHSCW